MRVRTRVTAEEPEAGTLRPLIGFCLRRAVAGLLSWHNHLHLLPVIRELRAAIQAHDMSTTLHSGSRTTARLYGDRERGPLMRAAKKNSEETRHANIRLE